MFIDVSEGHVASIPFSEHGGITSIRNLGEHQVRENDKGRSYNMYGGGVYTGSCWESQKERDH
jgi:hypothetical protein